MSSRSASPSIAQVFFTFLGTSSAVPTLRRNVTSAVLRCDGEAMVFDVGEGTQHQLMKSQVIRQGRIKRIFITHMHGDHTFGLPGLVTGLCGVKKDMLRDDPYPVRQASEKLRIYGPRGVKEFLLSALRLTRMRIPRDFFIHELIDTPEEASAIMAREAASGVNSAAGLTLHDPSEPASNTLVLPTLDAAGNRTWNLYDGPAFQMMAGAIAHTVPCWGYVFREHDQPGALDLERLMVSPLGSKRLGPWLQALKNGETIEGVRREDVCGPTLVGRKVVVMGDTCDPAGIAHLAHKCNLLVHEVTMRDSGSSGVEKAFKRGHSTTSMTAEFAHSVQAEELAVTHFGGEISANSGAAFPEIAHTVKQIFGKPPIFARDFLSVQVERKRCVALPVNDGVEDDVSWADPEDTEADDEAAAAAAASAAANGGAGGTAGAQ